MLKITNLKASRDGKRILNGISLKIKPGEIHALMGPNGSGKSTLAYALVGYPDVVVEKSSKVEIDGKDLFSMDISQRAKEGLLLAFQYPVEVPGVSVSEFLRMSYNEKHAYRDSSYKGISPFKFRELVLKKMEELEIDKSFLDRNINENFSGGEKKKFEILQLSILGPKYAILDETDSGLDVSSLKVVAKYTKKFFRSLNTGLLVITHYSRILTYLLPDYVHVLVNGQIIESGGPDLAYKLDKVGYENL